MLHLLRRARTRALSLTIAVVAALAVAAPTTNPTPADADDQVVVAALAAPIRPVEIDIDVHAAEVVEAIADHRDHLAAYRLDEARKNRLIEEAQRRRAEAIARREAEERAREEARRRAEERAEAERRAQAASAPVVTAGSVWDRLAACESSGNWASTVGTYEGGLQFHPSTWDAYKPSGYPEAAYQASREQQIAVAERVLASQGWGAWPACARKLGLR